MTTGRELEVNLSTLLGLNNRAPDFRLRTKAGSFVRSANNSLVSDSGSIKRRPGFGLKFSAADAHSFWVDEKTDTGFYADGPTLYRVSGAGGLRREIIATDLIAGRRLTYAAVGTDVVFSDGVKNRCAAADGVRPFGVAEVTPAPDVVAAAGGALAAGVYQVCFAFANEQHEVSGTTPPVALDVPAGGKIVASNLPLTWPAGAACLLVFASAPGGTQAYVERRLPSPTASVTIENVVGDGMAADTVDMEALPPGRILRYFASRLYVAIGPVLCYSGIYAPALYQPAKNYVVMPAPITVMEPCDDGMYLVADKTYWLAGDITAATLKEVSPCRAVFGTAGRMPHMTEVFWMSTRGLMTGKAGGEVTLLHDDAVAVPPAVSGASVVLEADGQRHAISTLSGAEPGAAAARSYMDAEVIRKGTTL